MGKIEKCRYPIETIFYDSVRLTNEDRNFLKERELFFNYLAQELENNGQKLDKILEFIVKK